MSKYIIELKDDVQAVQKVGVTENGNAFVMNFYKDQLEELTADYINEHYGELQDTAYQKGLNDAWEAARKIVCDEELDWNTLLHIFNRSNFEGIFGDFSPSEAIDKLKSYKEKQKADDKIEVGDEVKHKSDRVAWTAIVTRICCGTLTLMEHSGASADNYPIEDFVKTGRHFDIAKILEAMKA